MRHLQTLPAAQRWMLILLAVAVALANVDAPIPYISPLHHAPTVALILAAPALLRRWPLTDGAVAYIFVFFLLHTIGGRYTYTYVPYDDWSQALFGFRLSETFGWTRNHYDRLVHLAFGLLAILPVAEWQARYGGLSRRQAIASAIGFVLAVSALYEIFEWVITLVAAGATVENYNGQQGDVWDPQKDMALALLGAVIGALLPNKSVTRPHPSL